MNSPRPSRKVWCFKVFSLFPYSSSEEFVCFSETYNPFVILRNTERNVRFRCSFSPWESCYKVTLTENVAANLFNIVNFMVVNRDKDNAVVAQ